VTTKARALAIGLAFQAFVTTTKQHAARWWMASAGRFTRSLHPVVSPLDAPLFLERILMECAMFPFFADLT
jgi:hypothetical protein